MFSVTCQNGDQGTSKKIFKNTAMQTSEHSFLDGTRSPFPVGTAHRAAVHLVSILAALN